MKKQFSIRVFLLMLLASAIMTTVMGCAIKRNDLYQDILKPFEAQQLSVLSEKEHMQITLVNNTGFPIWYVYISLSTDNNWGDDLLADDQIIDDGESVNLNLPYSEEDRYDIMLEGSVGDIYIKQNEKIADNSSIVFTFDDIDIWRYLQ